MIGTRAEAGLNRRWRRRVRHRALFTPVNDEQGSLAEIHAPPVNNYRREWRGKVPIAGRAERSHAGAGAEGTGGRRQGALWSYGVRLLWFDKEPEILAGSIDKGVAKRASNRVKCGSRRRVKT